MFWRNLNVFIAGVALAQWVVGPVVMLLTLVATLVGGDVRLGFMFMPVVAFGLLVGLGSVWWKRGLAPQSIRSDRRKRSMYGHCMLGVGSVLALAPWLLLTIAFVSGWHGWQPAYHPNQRLLANAMPWLTPASLTLLLLGLVLVFSSSVASATGGAIQDGRNAA